MSAVSALGRVPVTGTDPAQLRRAGGLIKADAWSRPPS